MLYILVITEDSYRVFELLMAKEVVKFYMQKPRVIEGGGRRLRRGFSTVQQQLTAGNLAQNISIHMLEIFIILSNNKK
jgi:hypothetical protein